MPGSASMTYKALAVRSSIRTHPEETLRTINGHHPRGEPRATVRGQLVALYYMTVSMAGLFLGPTTVGLLSDLVFGNENLNYAAAAVPAIYGIPVLLLVFYARRIYQDEHNRQHGTPES